MQPLDKAIIGFTESVRQFTDSYHYIRGRILTCHTSTFITQLVMMMMMSLLYFDVSVCITILLTWLT